MTLREKKDKIDWWKYKPYSMAGIVNLRPVDTWGVSRRNSKGLWYGIGKKIIFIFTNGYKSGQQAEELLGVSLA